MKEENSRLKELAFERDAILAQCESKIKAYEHAAKEQHEVVNRVRTLEREVLSLR
jgi:hypothetical protein